MERAKNFTNLVERLSAKFPDLDKFYLFVHILGFISGFDKPLGFYIHSDVASIVSLYNFDKKIIQTIEEFFPKPIEQFTESERKELCKSFLETCLQFEKHVNNSPDNPATFLDDLFLSEPQAVSKINGWVSVDFSALSTKSQKEYIDWDVERYFYYKAPLIPEFLTEKIAALANPKNGQTIYDPNCNIGSIFVELYNKFPDLDLNFRGVVRNQYEWLLCIVNLYINGILDDKRVGVEIDLSSPFEDIPKDYSESKFADIAISVVPFAERLDENQLNSRFFGLSHGLETSEFSYIELILNATKENGRTIAVVPDYILNSSQSRYVREAYLSRDWIESVISLDKVDFNLDTFADASIVVFNKHKSIKDIVLFKGALGNTEVKTSIIKSEYDSCLKVTFFLDVKKQLEYIAEAFSTEFPDLAPFRYLYIIAGLTDKFVGKQFLSLFTFILLSGFFFRESVYLQKHGKGIDSLITTHIFTQDQVKEAVEYLVSRIFDSLNAIFPLSHRSWDEIIDDLANREPDAVQIKTTSSGEKIESIDWNELSYSALNEFTRREIHSAFQNPQYLFPSKELERTLVELAAPKTEQIIYNPNCGVGSIFVEFEKQYPNHNLKYYGVLSDKFSELLCEANLYINGINAEINSEGLYNQTLSFNEELSIWEGVKSDNISFYDEDSSEWQDINIVDIAIGIPEFTERVHLGKYKPLEMLSLKELTRNEYALVEEMLSRLNETGKAIVVVPNSFLFSSHGKSYRQKYLSLDLIEKIISLPDDTFKSKGSIKTSIIVFNKNKSNKNIILFDGKEDRFEKTQISVDSIISENKTDLSPSRYALKEGKKLTDIFADSQHPIKKIKDLIDFSILGSNRSAKSKPIENSSETLPFIRVTDLSKNDKDFELDISKIERNISIKNARKIIDFDAVLVNRIGTKLKPTKFKYEGKPIVIGSDVIALKMKADVNIEYFITQFHSRLVQVQIEMFSSGNVISRVSKEDFLNIQIRLPPSLAEQIAEQKLQIFERSGVDAEQAIIQEQISIAKKEIETTEYDVIAAITHNLNQKLGQIVDDYGTLILFLQNKEKNQMPIRFDEMLRPVRNGELIDNIPTFSKVANRLQNNLLDTAYTMKTTENILQKSVINTEDLDIIRFFRKSIKADFENPQFTLKIESKLKSLIVLADINALKDAFRNLIENAKKHGFTQDDQKYQIVFEISTYTNNSGENFARIVYKNNGNPFPKSYKFEDYTRLGTRMGKNKGTGIGGFFVKKVIDLHKGSFKEITLHENNQETFQVQMEILLPLAD